MVRKNKMLAIAAVTALLGVTSGCGSDDDSPSTSGGPEKADMVVWLNGADTPQEARDWLKETFEADHPGSTLTIEEQEWDGLVERLTTALSSERRDPDVVEFGNTQAPTFTAAGAVVDLTARQGRPRRRRLAAGLRRGRDVGRQDSTPCRTTRARLVFYRKDLFEKAGIEVPTTLEEFVAAGDRAEGRQRHGELLGHCLPGKNWRDGAAYLWDAGGDFAAPDGDGWAGLSSPESIAGLTRSRPVFDEAYGAPADANEPTRSRPSAPARSA